MQVHHAVFDDVIKKCRDLDPIAVAIVSPLSEVALKSESTMGSNIDNPCGVPC
jgi:hypothetical protein